MIRAGSEAIRPHRTVNGGLLPFGILAAQAPATPRPRPTHLPRVRHHCRAIDRPWLAIATGSPQKRWTAGLPLPIVWQRATFGSFDPVLSLSRRHYQFSQAAAFQIGSSQASRIGQRRVAITFCPFIYCSTCPTSVRSRSQFRERVHCCATTGKQQIREIPTPKR